MITWAYESVWFDAWPQNKNGSLWPTFNGSVILRYIFKTYWCINMIPWNNESVWLDALPQNKTVSLWPVFHGSVILPYILKAIWCINMILWANKSVWLDASPQNKSWSLWPIFHCSVAYILKTILCIRRWHWPGVYVSPCSLALVFVHYFTIHTKIFVYIVHCFNFNSSIFPDNSFKKYICRKIAFSFMSTSDYHQVCILLLSC